MAQTPTTTLIAAKRAVELVTLLMRFGFGELVTRTGLRGYLPKGWSKAVSQADDQPMPARVRLLLQELGPTFIKAGQILSTRPDLIPVAWTHEFKKLQSNVPPTPWDQPQGSSGETVASLLAAQWGEDWRDQFESFDQEPIAAASMGQVYAATLQGGQDVVVKVLRPGIHERIAGDMQLMRWFSGFIRSEMAEQGLDIDAIVDEFAHQLERETDLTIEARSTQRMRADFADHPGVCFPKIYELFTRQSLLVQQRVHGRLLSELAYESLSQEDRRHVVKNAADAVFRQCLDLGFFHADPHPGNIFLLDGNRLCFIDCGMTGIIDPQTTALLARLVYGATEGDLNGVVRAAIRIAGAEPGLMDNRRLRVDTWRFLDSFRGGDLASIHMGALLNEFMSLLRRHKMQCPADIVHLIKAIATIEGVAQEMDPDFDLVAHARPYVERLMKQRYTLEAVKQRGMDALVSYSDMLEEMPMQLSGMMRLIRKNEVSLQLRHEGAEELGRSIRESSMNVAWSLVLSSVVVGSSVLILADSRYEEITHLTVIATLGLLGATAVGVVRLLRLWARHRAIE